MESSSIVKELLQNEKELCRSAVNTLLKIANNVINNPNEEKYRKINLSSEVTEKYIFPAVGALEVLFLMGFEEGEDKLLLPKDASLDVLKSYRDQLQQLKNEKFPEKTPERQQCVNNESIPQTSSSLIHLMLEEEKMRRELEHEFEQVLLFESTRFQEEARKVMPHQSLYKKAKEREAQLKSQKSQNDTPNYDSQDCILVELLAWFKEDFFEWFDKGFCVPCAKKMNLIGCCEPNQEEKEYGGHRVELYECESCKSELRFPRYFHPGKLLETRKGRCMEWASCFTLMCRALGLDARYIWDKTDHVWTEVFSISQNRWIHADPCENKVDTPLMYEKGWKKQLSYIFAFSKDEVVDCVWRYSADHKEVVSRRKSCRENWLLNTIAALNKERQKNFPEAKRKFLELRLVREVTEFLTEPKDPQGNYEGRLSGSLAWRVERGETQDKNGSKNDSIVPYSFVPNEEEIEQKMIVVKYSSSQDAYFRDISNQKMDGWRSGVFTSKNVMRKHEKDWKTIYISRTEHSSEGEISWKFDWSTLSLKVESVLLVFQHKTYETGTVHWQICNGDSCFPGNQNGVLQLSSKELEGSSHVEVSALLSGGKGDVAWQHAQLFRQGEQDKEFPFFIKIKFL